MDERRIQERKQEKPEDVRSEKKSEPGKDRSPTEKKQDEKQSVASTGQVDNSPGSFRNAAAQSGEANGVAAERNRKYEAYQRNQLDYDRRIDQASSPLTKERLTYERDLAKNLHLSESKSWLLNKGSSAIGNDQATKDRLNKEIADHRQQSKELREKLEPENHAYNRLEARVQQHRDDAARDGVRGAPESVKEKARDNQIALEQLRERNQMKSRDQQVVQNQKQDSGKDKQLDEKRSVDSEKVEREPFKRLGGEGQEKDSKAQVAVTEQKRDERPVEQSQQAVQEQSREEERTR